MNIMQSPTTTTPATAAPSRIAAVTRALGYMLVGAYFGIILIKGQVADWFRIQEMFRLQQFHMYGIIGSAIATAMFSVWLLRRLQARSTKGVPITVSSRQLNKGQIIGGILFGFGWAATGACPGPLFAQIGCGASIIVVTLLSALAGTWIYGWLRPRLPH
jgi:uncharacterized membrane protein YedE/YeeE